MKTKQELKKKIVEEMQELILLTIFLSLFLLSLTVYRGLLLGQTIFSFFHFGYNVIEALILAKIILLGKIFKIGERFADKSLFIPTLYKTFLFTLLAFVFSLLEHFVFGLFEKKNLDIVWHEFINQGINEICGKLLITFLVFILLFSFLELCRILGEGKAFELFFRRKKINDN